MHPWKRLLLHRLDNLATRLFFFLRKQMRKYSLPGDREAFDSAQFPEVISALEGNWSDIRKELDALLPRVDEMPDFRTLTPSLKPLTPFNNWRMFVLYAYGRKSERNCRLCPVTAAILKSVPGMKTAFFSILAPGTHIAPHFGVYPGVLRVHLGLRVPVDRDNCWIQVGSSRLTWKEGECVIFDDSYTHEVCNATDEMRVVLFIDIKRPLPVLGDILNEVLIRLLSRTGLVQEGARNEDAWEKEFHREPD
jgi:beta-hydroxylase